MSFADNDVRPCSYPNWKLGRKRQTGSEPDRRILEELEGAAASSRPTVQRAVRRVTGPLSPVDCMQLGSCSMQSQDAPSICIVVPGNQVRGRGRSFVGHEPCFGMIVWLQHCGAQSCISQGYLAHKGQFDLDRSMMGPSLLALSKDISPQLLG